MPVQPRPSDTFTRDNLLLGFSVVEFTPNSTGVAVPLGILSGQTLQKEIETLQLERGDAGTLTVDREVVSRFSTNMTFELFNFKADIAQYIFASSVLTPITANAAAAGNGNYSLPANNAFDQFLDLPNATINESSVEVTFQEVENEAVGTGDGASGGTQGDFALDQKIKAILDVTSFTVNGVEEVSNLVAGSTPLAGEIAIEIGEEDSTTTGSGTITFGASKIPANGATIVATYTPSFSTTGTDIVNLTDFVFDPTLGKIRMLNAGADAGPFRVDGAEAALNAAYTFNQKAANSLDPFTQLSFEGSAVIRHLPDTGINFIWTIPSATIRVTDDDLTFGAEDFATATMQMNINDAGGSQRFGTLELSSESEANA